MAEQVERWPGAPGEIVAAGHEVAVHGYNHRGHLRRTPWDLEQDLRRARAIIEDAAGYETTLYRAPYGVFAFGSWRETAAQGWTRVLWSRWGKDWEERATPQRIADLIGRPVAGDILLLHRLRSLQRSELLAKHAWRVADHPELDRASRFQGKNRD